MGLKDKIKEDAFAPAECKQVWELLRDSLTGTLPEMPKLAEQHIADCPNCKVKFLHLVDTILGGKLKNLVPGLITCEQAFEQTAPFIDWELDHGVETAHRHYPKFIEHVGHCADCFELYWMTKKSVQDMRDEGFDLKF